MGMNNSKMIFIPNTFYDDKIQTLGLNEYEFLELQIKYKQLFEKMIISKFDFSEIEKELKELNYPIVDDKSNNFYRCYSTLGSSYIYFRNNIHIENLSKEEINQLRNEDVGIDFLKNTYDRVLFEEGDYTFLGNPCDETKVLSQSIMLELAVDFAEISDLNQAFKIEEIVEKFKNKCISDFEPIVSDLLGVSILPVDASYYNAMPDYYGINSIGNKQK